ncbi:succinyl-diaminopimelate desuccinylase [Demequina mangrovi]|uniref:Succinyl-diaminopimelate desuccinylase n=1 Tax=Demequina mangrovi TaxID=1043493 RepID=A0A1H6Y2K0_9MICO|nr:succinyl-diaminopimelate desuccinylase [Demequina mangrovi]SEJ34124.1 succinyldiaminopimelate desuccinylase [Demequina mangrovi]
MTHLDLAASVEDLAKALVDIPSVSGNEDRIADAVEAALAPLEHLEVIRLGNAIVARTALGRAERVVIAGHLDTVPIKGNVPGEWSPEGDLVGRGSVDMKAGVAVQLSLAAALDAPTRDVTWVFYDQEEVEAVRNGLGRVARERPDLVEGDFAVLCEPTSGVIEGGCNGTMRAEVRIPGRAAHSARAWKGVNAVHRAAPLLAALAAYEAETIAVDGLEYREGINAVGISGGIAGNVIPDECIVTVNYRFAPCWTLEQAQERLEGLIASAGLDAYVVVYTDLSGAARPGLDAPLAASFAASVAATGVDAPRAKQGWTDVARFGELGIPAVNYGPGDPELAHADDERCPVEDIRNCRAGLEAWLTS